MPGTLGGLMEITNLRQILDIYSRQFEQNLVQSPNYLGREPPTPQKNLLVASDTYE